MGFLRLQRIEKEYEQLKLENPKLRLEIDKLRDVSAARFLLWEQECLQSIFIWFYRKK